MKKKILLLVVFALFFSGCNSKSDKEITNVAQWDKCVGELLESEVTAASDGKNVIRVYVNFTNHSDEGLYLYQCFGIQAYQDDVGITDVTDINGADANTVVAIKNGKSIIGSFAFELRSDSVVEIKLHSPTADSVLLAKKSYEIKQ